MLAEGVGGVVYRTRAYCACRRCGWGLFTGQGPTVLAEGVGGVVYRTRAYCACSGSCAWGYLDIFVCHLSFLSPSLSGRWLNID